MINEMRKAHLSLRELEKQNQKISPAMNRLKDLMTGAPSRATPERITQNYAQLSEHEKEDLHAFVRERYSGLSALIAALGERGDGLSDYKSQREAAATVADTIGLDISDIRQ